MTGVIPFVIFIIVLGIDPDKLGLAWGRTFRYWYFPVLLPLLTVLYEFSDRFVPDRFSHSCLYGCNH